MMFSQILKDLITLHKLDSAGNVKSKEKENKSSKHDSKSNKTANSNYIDSFGPKKLEAHTDLTKEFKFKSNQSSNHKYNESSSSGGNKTSFGLKTPISSKMQSSQAKIENINVTSSNKRNTGANNLDSKSSVNFYFSPNDKSQKSDAHIANDLKSASSKQAADYKSRDYKNSFAIVNDNHHHHQHNNNHQHENELNPNLPGKNQNGSDASLRTRKQDALIDLAILLKKSQSKINLNGKLEDSTKLFEIQATLANEFKTAMLNKNEQEAKAAAEKAAAISASERNKKAENNNNANNPNTNAAEQFNPKYEALTKLTDEFRKNFTEIKKAYLNKDPQIVSNANPDENLQVNHRKGENQLSNDFKNSTAQINKSLKNLESKSSATLNSKFLKQDIAQHSTIANEFKLSASRKNLASKSSATFFSNVSAPKPVKSDATQPTDFKLDDQPVIRKTLASKSSANLYEPSSQVLKSNTQANLVNEFKLSAARKGLTSKSSANLYNIDANTGNNMYKSDTQPNLAREFKSSFAQLKALKDTFAKSSHNINSTSTNNTTPNTNFANVNTNNNNNNYSQHNLKNMYIQSNEYGDTYIVQRPDQAMTLTNSSDLRLNQENTKSAYNLTKADSNPTVAFSKELKASTKNLNEIGLNKKKSNNSAELRKSTIFSTGKDLKSYEHQAKLVNEFRALASRSNKNLESKSSSTFFLNTEPTSMLSQPSTHQLSNKLDTQTSLAKEFKKSYTNLTLKDASKTSGISSIYMSQQSESPITDSSVDYEVNTVMNLQKPSNNVVSEYKTTYIQPQQSQPILVGNFNKGAAEESQELLIELERTGISSSTPIETINETRDSDLQNLNASELQKWIWTNEQEANNSLSPIPLNEYPINQDPNPIVIKKKPDQKVELKKEFFVRYLQPPRPLTPGKLIIEQEANVLPPEAPPIVIRQRPNRNRTPEPIIIREAPPTPPPVPPKQIITIPGKTIRQPREIIYEQPPKVKCEPQMVCHESCMPCNYCYQNGNMFQESWHPYNNGSNVSYQNQNVFHETWVPYKNQNSGNVYAQNQMPPSWISYNNQPMFNQGPWNSNSAPYPNIPQPYNSSAPVYKYY